MNLIKYCFIFFCLFSLLFSKNTNQQIKTNESSLATKEKQEREINRHLSEIAKSLKNEETSLLKTEKEIAILDDKIKKQQNIVDVTKVELDELTNKNNELEKIQKDIEHSMSKLIAKEFSYMMLIDKGYMESQDSIITNEILKQVSKSLNSELAEYGNVLLFTNKKISEYTDKINEIKETIKDLEERKKTLSILKKNKTDIIQKIEKEKVEYVKQLQKIKIEKDELKNTLSNLKIIEQQKKIVEKKPTTTEETIRQLGSSYQASKVKKYTGQKTISPLNKYTVVQKFGDYVDPVYNIKIFNESVVLRASVANDEVKSVLDGKIIFAKETQMLKNVIVIENANGIHTIYAHLSKIAPTIKVGSKVKKGYVIGRVNRDLTFEVTQKNYHINPLELISK